MSPPAIACITPSELTCSPVSSATFLRSRITISLEQVRTIIDADTVVGKQMVTPSGTVIIPISKVSMGFASGGLDLPSEENDVKNFGGGGGTGVTVTPIGFLTVYADGRVEMLPIVQEKSSSIEQVADLLDQAPSIINRIKDAIVGILPEAEDTATPEEAAKAEETYDALIDEDLALGLSEKELKKLRKMEAKAAKKQK